MLDNLLASGFVVLLAQMIDRHTCTVEAELVSSPDPPHHALSENWRGKNGRRVW